MLLRDEDRNVQVAAIRGFLAFEAATFAIAALVQSPRTVGLVAQGFALLGTLVGIFTIVAGIGPRTVPDISYRLTITAVLIIGLIVAGRAQAR